MNNFEIKNDGINVYVTFFVNSHPVGKILLTIFVVFLIGLLFYLPSTFSKEEISDYIFPFIIFGIIVFVFPFRYLLWNLFGKENLIISTKSLSYYRDYGVYRTNLKTLNHNRLGTGFECSRTYDNVKYGNLVFEKYNDETDVPEHLYTTSVVLNFESIEKIDKEISKIYEIKMDEELGFHPVSLN
jgi:hypothetical protein